KACEDFKRNHALISMSAEVRMALLKFGASLGPSLTPFPLGKGNNGMFSPEGRGGERMRFTHGFHSIRTGILPIFACHSRGPVLCTEVPAESTATVTGM